MPKSVLRSAENCALGRRFGYLGISVARLGRPAATDMLRRVPAPHRVGVFGGTFDPPHVGHLVAAVNVAAHLQLDQVLFVVANIPWQKVGSREISDPTDRLDMVGLAVGDRPDLVCSDIEIELGGDSVTADTLEVLMERDPGVEPVIIVGSDAAAGLGTWRRRDELAKLATVAVVDRPGATGRRPPPDFDHVVVPCPLMDLSSSDIRRRVREGLPIDYLVPDAVRDLISSRMLYAA